ncbi:MAG: hypothetical protein IPO62_11960 [Saprospiraceae bacterium]|nr:hypothetical protein [Saprospiraceae bacterium]
MRRLILLFIVCLKSLIVFSQDTIYAPPFDFEGTNVLWHHRPVEVSDIKNQIGLILQRELLYPHLSPLIVNDRLYYLLDNGGGFSNPGSTLICYNHNTGDTIWQRNYNLKFYGKGFTYFWDMQNFGENIELFGYAWKDTILYNISGLKAGFTHLRKVDKNGHDIEEKINLENHNRVTFQECVPPVYLEGHDHAWFYQVGYIESGSSYNHFAKPWVWDKDFNIRELPEFDINIQAPLSYNSLDLHGAIEINPNKYLFFADLFLTDSNSRRHYVWSTSASGKPEGLRDISDVIGRDKRVIDWEKSKNGVRLRVWGHSKIHKKQYEGYIYFDENGMVIKDQRELNFEGKLVGRMKSLDLKGNNEILHVINLLDEPTALYFYKEYPDGRMVKCGEMLSRADPKFIFFPTHVLQTKEGDIILSLTAQLDNQSGGWPYICKIDGKELSLISSTDNSNSNPLFLCFRIQLKHKCSLSYWLN